MKIDQRACGKGKTTQFIYKIINKAIKLNNKTLIVAGSIALQQQYKAQYPDIKIINHGEADNSTVSEVMLSMYSGIDFICITHQTFMMLPYSEARRNYQLIIDEAIGNLVREHTIYIKDTGLLNINWSKHYKIFDNDFYAEPMDKPSNTNFYQMELENISDDNITNQSRTYREITDSNYNYYITPYNYKIMMDSTTDKAFQFMSMANTNVFHNWDYIYVAAAGFDFASEMYYVLNYHGMNMDFHSKFEKHTGNIHLHVGFIDNDENIHISKTKLDNHPELISQYHDYVNKHKTGTVLALRNKDITKTLNDELLLSHNVHGINSPVYRSCSNVSLESALLPSNHRKNFYLRLLLKDQKLPNPEFTINILCYGYLFYQAAMRCGLRDALPNPDIEFHFYMYDCMVGSVMSQFLDVPDENHHYFDLTTIKAEVYKSGKKKGLPKKPMKNTDKQKAYRERKKSANSVTIT